MRCGRCSLKVFSLSRSDAFVAPLAAASGVATRHFSCSPTLLSIRDRRGREVEGARPVTCPASLPGCSGGGGLSLPVVAASRFLLAAAASSAACGPRVVVVGDGREADILFIRGWRDAAAAADQRPFVTRVGHAATMEADRATASAAKKMRVAGLVLARGGSEAVKKKNARLLCGLPLLSWVLRPMKHCKSTCAHASAFSFASSSSSSSSYTIRIVSERAIQLAFPFCVPIVYWREKKK